MKKKEGLSRLLEIAGEKKSFPTIYLNVPNKISDIVLSITR